MSRKNGLEQFHIFSDTKVSYYYRRNPDRVSIIKQSLLIILVSCINGAAGFGPVPRSTIEVERKGQIRDWPKRASYMQEIRLQTPLMDEGYFRYFKQNLIVDLNSLAIVSYWQQFLRH